MKNLKETLKNMPPEEKAVMIMMAVSLLGMIGSAVYSMITGRGINVPTRIISW